MTKVRKPRRRGTPGHPYPPEVVAYARRKLKEDKTASSRSVAKELGIHSHMTVLRWTKSDMSPTGRALRLTNRGPERKLPPELEVIAAGWVVFRAINHLSTSSSVVDSFFRQVLQIEPKSSWKSKWAKRHHLSWTRSAHFIQGMDDEDAFDRAVKFLREVRKLNKLPSQICCLDKTSIYENVTGIRELGPKGSGTQHRLRSKRGKKDSVYTLLVGDGRQGPFYLVTSAKNVPVDFLPDAKIDVLPESASKRGETAMLHWCEWAIEIGVLEDGDLLLTDNESSLGTEFVDAFLDHHGISHLRFPPYLGSLMNPCDNSFHSVFKHSLYEAIHCEEQVDRLVKIKLAHQAYTSISDKAIQNMFDHVGLGTRDPIAALSDVFTEGLHIGEAWQETHSLQLDIFVDWCAVTGFEEDLPENRKPITVLPIKKTT